MHERLQSLNEQKEYLSSQLKAVMKRSRLLELEITYNNQTNNDDNGDDNLQNFAFETMGEDGQYVIISFYIIACGCVCVCIVLM